MRVLAHHRARRLPSGLRRHATPALRPAPLDLGLDQITATGLPVRDALPVRSAEYWLQLGAQDLALQELAMFLEPARRHTLPTRAHPPRNPLNAL